ncbi:MAG TPA: hypothetical protein VK074_02425, partial [Fodinibius sp.]|nr:hypothetical protein [Fodinibius sp.]
MNDQLARSLFMDYLYDEISEEEKSKLESYLEENPRLQRELSELEETRSLLQKMPDVDTAPQLLVVEPRRRTFKQWWREARGLLPRSFFAKTAISAAAVLFLVLIVGSAAQLQVDISGQGVAVNMGHTPGPGGGLTDEQADDLANRIQRQNAKIMSDYVDALNQQNREQLQQVVNHFQQQRIND